jgi:hypothetical protein
MGIHIHHHVFLCTAEIDRLFMRAILMMWGRRGKSEGGNTGIKFKDTMTIKDLMGGGHTTIK